MRVLDEPQVTTDVDMTCDLCGRKKHILHAGSFHWEGRMTLRLHKEGMLGQPAGTWVCSPCLERMTEVLDRAHREFKS